MHQNWMSITFSSYSTIVMDIQQMFENRRDLLSRMLVLTPGSSNMAGCHKTESIPWKKAQPFSINLDCLNALLEACTTDEFVFDEGLERYYPDSDVHLVRAGWRLVEVVPSSNPVSQDSIDDTLLCKLADSSCLFLEFFDKYEDVCSFQLPEQNLLLEETTSTHYLDSYKDNFSYVVNSISHLKPKNVQDPFRMKDGSFCSERKLICSNDQMFRCPSPRPTNQSLNGAANDERFAKELLHDQYAACWDWELMEVGGTEMGNCDQQCAPTLLHPLQTLVPEIFTDRIGGLAEEVSRLTTVERVILECHQPDSSTEPSLHFLALNSTGIDIHNVDPEAWLLEAPLRSTLPSAAHVQLVESLQVAPLKQAAQGPMREGLMTASEVRHVEVELWAHEKQLNDILMLQLPAQGAVSERGAAASRAAACWQPGLLAMLGAHTAEELSSDLELRLPWNPLQAATQVMKHFCASERFSVECDSLTEASTTPEAYSIYSTRQLQGGLIEEEVSIKATESSRTQQKSPCTPGQRTGHCVVTHNTISGSESVVSEMSAAEKPQRSRLVTIAPGLDPLDTFLMMRQLSVAETECRPRECFGRATDTRQTHSGTRPARPLASLNKQRNDLGVEETGEAKLPTTVSRMVDVEVTGSSTVVCCEEDIPIVIVSQRVTANAQLLHALESRCGVVAVEREDDRVAGGGPDVTVDAGAAVVLAPAASLQHESGRAALARRVCALYPAFTDCWVLLTPPAYSNTYCLQGSVVRDAAILEDACSMETEDFNVQVVCALSVGDVAVFVKALVEQRRASALSPGDRDVPDQWAPRNWVSSAVSPEEKLLVSMRCFNFLSAQLVLQSLSADQVLSLTPPELARACPYLSHSALELFDEFRKHCRIEGNFAHPLDTSHMTEEALSDKLGRIELHKDAGPEGPCGAGGPPIYHRAAAAFDEDGWDYRFPGDSRACSTGDVQPATLPHYSPPMRNRQGELCVDETNADSGWKLPENRTSLSGGNSRHDQENCAEHQNYASTSKYRRPDPHQAITHTAAQSSFSGLGDPAPFNLSTDREDQLEDLHRHSVIREDTVDFSDTGSPRFEPTTPHASTAANWEASEAGPLSQDLYSACLPPRELIEKNMCSKPTLYNGPGYGPDDEQNQFTEGNDVFMQRTKDLVEQFLQEQTRQPVASSARKTRAPFMVRGDSAHRKGGGEAVRAAAGEEQEEGAGRDTQSWPRSPRQASTLRAEFEALQRKHRDNQLAEIRLALAGQPMGGGTLPRAPPSTTPTTVSRGDVSASLQSISTPRYLSTYSFAGGDFRGRCDENEAEPYSDSQNGASCGARRWATPTVAAVMPHVRHPDTGLAAPVLADFSTPAKPPHRVLAGGDAACFADSPPMDYDEASGYDIGRPRPPHQSRSAPRQRAAYQDWCPGENSALPASFSSVSTKAGQSSGQIRLCNRKRKLTYERVPGKSG